MIQINGKKLECIVCGETHFTKKRSKMISRSEKVLSVDWHQAAINYICDNCGYIFWFIDDGREYSTKLAAERKSKDDVMVSDYEKSKPNENECPNCFNKVVEDDKECPNCGHVLDKS